MDRRTELDTLGVHTVVRLRPPVVHRRRRTDPPLPTAPTDHALLVCAGGGDASAWEALVQAHLPQVWRWASAACADPADAEGVCELVWLRLAQSLPGRAREPLLPWLHRTVTKEAARVARPVIPGPRRAPARQTTATGAAGVPSGLPPFRPPAVGGPRVC